MPTVHVPHFLDQPVWAHLSLALGCSGATVPYHRLTAHNLGNAVCRTLASPRCRAAARAVGQSIEAEQGLLTAVECIEAMDRSVMKARFPQ